MRQFNSAETTLTVGSTTFVYDKAGQLIAAIESAALRIPGMTNLSTFARSLVVLGTPTNNRAKAEENKLQLAVAIQEGQAVLRFGREVAQPLPSQQIPEAVETAIEDLIKAMKAFCKARGINHADRSNAFGAAISQLYMVLAHAVKGWYGYQVINAIVAYSAFIQNAVAVQESSVSTPTLELPEFAPEAFTVESASQEPWAASHEIGAGSAQASAPTSAQGRRAPALAGAQG